MNSIFHLAFNVTDLDKARVFYGELLQCREGRSTKNWVDFNFYGHQISLHLGKPLETSNTGKVGEHKVPMPHFGVILDRDKWEVLAERLIDSDINFEIPPCTRFEGEPGEQSTMFFRDFCGNPIEIKSFQNIVKVFEK
ncbi:MAG: dioxygenase [Kangiella sp.]|nr:MAG: dioxygenase [Kangiella sp.]